MLHPSVTLFFSFATPGYFLQTQHVKIYFTTSISIHDTDLESLVFWPKMQFLSCHLVINSRSCFILFFSHNLINCKFQNLADCIGCIFFFDTRKHSVSYFAIFCFHYFYFYANFFHLVILTGLYNHLVLFPVFNNINIQKVTI